MSRGRATPTRQDTTSHNKPQQVTTTTTTTTTTITTAAAAATTTTTHNMCSLVMAQSIRELDRTVCARAATRTHFLCAQPHIY